MSSASGTMMLLRMGFSLALILGMIWLAARVLRRKGKLGNATGTDLELVSRRAMGRRSNLVVVKVGGRTLLVGSTDTQVSLVADLTAGGVAGAPIETAAIETAAIETASIEEAEAVEVDSTPIDLTRLLLPKMIAPKMSISSGDLLETIRSRTVRRG